jgi:tRNA(Ile2)-agmatinylcytidine synthase
MFVAFDDTDSLESMCTTFLATELVKALSVYDLIGLPRLVRLNPAVPWKTRGNGALCLRFGVGKGQCCMVGEIDGRAVYSYERMYEEADRELVLDISQKVVGKWSRTSEGASPGLVVSRHKPAQRLYWEAVRGIVEKGDTLRELQKIGADMVGWEGGRGLIRASAAMAWRPHDRTFEIITYRHPDKWGTPRQLDDESVRDMDLKYPSTFNNFDHRTGRRAISPHTPCPVLLGVRGDDPKDLMSAVFSLRSEQPARWLMFLSNQGTDDHLVMTEPSLPDRSYDFIGTVAGTPITVPGGHVIFPIRTSKGELDCAAYEPTKEFRDLVRALRPGDRLRAVGELRAEPRTLNLEKMQVLETAQDLKKVANPRCPSCAGPTKSVGSIGGYRCKRCGLKNDLAPESIEVPRTIAPGWYEPPVCARRHLGKPLKRQGLQRQKS